MTLGIYLASSGAVRADEEGDLKRAVELMVRGDDKEAMRLLTQVIESGKLSAGSQADAYGNRSSINVYMGRYPEAIADASMAIRLRPETPFVYYNRGFAYCATGKEDLGLADFKAVTRFRSDDAVLKAKDPAPFFARGMCYFHKKEYTKAIADFDKALRLNPGYGDALTNRGVSFLGMGKFDRALSDFTAALKLSPDDPGGYVNLGLAHKGLHRYDDALKDFSEAIRLRPDYAEAYSQRGTIYSWQDKLDQALLDINEAIRLNPQAVEVYRHRGNINGKLGKFDSAITDYGVILQANPADADAAFSRGVTYFQQGDYQRAISDFDVAGFAGKNALFTHYYRGTSRFILGRFAEANADFEAILKQSTTNSAVPYLLLYITHGKTQGASFIELGHDPAKINLKDWPGPILALYLGKATPDQVRAAAAQGDAERQDMRKCEANFYVGEYELQRNNKEAATLLLQQARDSCSKSIFEQRAAMAELERIGR